MTSINDILKSIQYATSLTEKVGITSQVMDILRYQIQLKNKLGALNTLSGIGKSEIPKAIFNIPNQSIVEAFTKSMALQTKIPLSAMGAATTALALQTKLAIPTSAIAALQAASKHHQQILTNFKSIADSFRYHQPALSQLNNLQFALRGISAQFGAIAAAHQNWELLSDVETISKQALDISNRVSNDTVLTEEESKQFEALIELISGFLKKNKKFAVNAFRFLTIIATFMSFHQYFDFIRIKPEPATKEDVQKSESRILKTIIDTLKEQNEFRTTNRSCKVHLKPASKTTIIALLPKEFDVICLQVHHKWVYVSYFSADDNLPQTGWILKKYLDKP